MTKLTDLQKKKIVQAATAYLAEHKDVSQVKLAQLTGVEKTYMNQMLNGKTHVGNTEIADKYYNAIASYLGIPVKSVSWGHFNTYNFKKIVNKLASTRENTDRCGIDGATGTGKTYACNVFKRRFPASTFLVKCNATDNAKEFVQGICTEVGISDVGTKGKLVKRIAEHLINMGNNPILIIDEAENLGRAGIEIVKVLADLLENRVALAIVGLDIRKILLTGSKRKKQGYIQTNRRFSYGWIEVTPVTGSDIDEVCQAVGITSRSALTWMHQHITDYDSLRRVCTEAISEAEKSGSEINRKLLDELFAETTKYR